MQIIFETKDTRARLDVSRVALFRGPGDNSSALMALLAHGPQQSCRGLAAILQTNIKCRLELNDDGRSMYVSKFEGGYKVHKHQLYQGAWQFAFLAKADNLLLAPGEESLWRHLMGPRYSTPLLRSWLPVVSEQLESQGLLVACDGIADGQGLGEHGQSGVRMVLASSDDLDRIVSEELKAGRLKVEEAPRPL